MPRRVLVIVPAALPPPDAVLERLPELSDTGAVEVKIVSPASDLSFGQWLANEEDSARAEAERTAAETSDALAPGARVVEAAAGDVDPVQAAEDALSSFAADEIVVVLPSERGPGRNPSWVERVTAADFERLGLPVRIVGGAPGRA